MSASTKPENEDEKLIECGKYYDVLYGFSQTILKINDHAIDGEEVIRLQGQCMKILPAFITLCGIGLKEQPKKKKLRARTVLHSNIQTRDGWGLCPKCGGKCIKVTDNTILVNYPMYCKKCKSESLVTWRKEQN